MLSSSEVFQEVGPNQVHACCMYTARLELVFKSLFLITKATQLPKMFVDIFFCV